MSNIIKVKFFKGSLPIGREYAYYTPVEVDVGDVVDVETKHGKARAMVSRVDVPEEEIAAYADRAKSIIGKTELRCEYCDHFTAIGQGDHICDEDPMKMPVSEYAPTEDYFWCKGANFTDAKESRE